MNTDLIDPLFADKLTAAVAGLLGGTGTPGASVVLLLDGKPMLEAGVGCQDLSRTVPLAADASFYLYSLTKTLIAAALLQQVERGAVALDRPIQAYLPGAGLARAVSVRQLLNHTAALPDYGGMAAYHDAVRDHPGNPWPVARFLQLLEQMEEPVPRWRYSNVGYLLLRLLLEQVTGRSLREALHTQLFAPLGLQNSFVAETLADGSALTPGYSDFFAQDGPLENATGRYHPGWVAHGVVISTAPEVARLFQALFAGDLLSRSLREAMVEPVVLPFAHPFFAQPAYGLGVMIDAASPHGPLLGHAGGGPGYATGALCWPNVDGHTIVAVALANRDAPDLGLRIAHRLGATVAEALQR